MTIMNKKELRVGNVVELLTSNTKIYLPTGVYAVIEEIRDVKVKLRLDYKESDGLCYFNRNYETIRPAKITQEILQKIGFEELIIEEYPVYLHKNMSIEYYEDECILYIGEDDKPKRIKYIHQLQNYCYYNMDEELIFNVK